MSRRKALKWTVGLEEWTHSVENSPASSDEDRQYVRGVRVYVHSLRHDDSDPSDNRNESWTATTMDGLQDANFLVNKVIKSGVIPGTNFLSLLKTARTQRVAEDRFFLSGNPLITSAGAASPTRPASPLDAIEGLTPEERERLREALNQAAQSPSTEESFDG